MIILGMACSEFIRTQTVGTLIQLFRKNPKMGLIIKQSPYVHANRENVVVDAMNRGCSHIFFVDSDMLFKPDVLDKLLEHDKNVVGALYNMRRGKQHDPVVEKKSDELFKSDTVATGCLLIKAEVFKNTPRPWFFLGKEDEWLGEDVYFSKKAREAGYDLWIDPTLEVGHIGEFIY